MSQTDTAPPPIPLLCSVDQVAYLLGVRRTFVYSLIANKRLPSHKLGRLRKIARSDLAAFVEQVLADVDTEHHK